MPNIITANLEETVVEAAKKIVEHEVDSLPVVNPVITTAHEDKYEVVGRITKTNIARLFLDLASK
jgi:CBS domain-containing protein